MKHVKILVVGFIFVLVVFCLILLCCVQNTLLEFKKVVNAKQQVVSGTLYYLTLEVANGGKNEVYEAKIWEKPWLNFKEVQEFKLIGDASSGSSA
jgi:outer membrane lipoprotein-sorting protein